MNICLICARSVLVTFTFARRVLCLLYHMFADSAHMNKNQHHHFSSSTVFHVERFRLFSFCYHLLLLIINYSHKYALLIISHEQYKQVKLEV